MGYGNAISENYTDVMRLVSYLESVHSAEFRDIRHHLATCSICREKVMDIQSTINSLKGFVPSASGYPGGEHPGELAIAGYVDRKLPPDRLSEISQHLDQCGYCTKATLHYAICSVEMGRKNPPMDSEVQRFLRQSEPEKRSRRNWRFRSLFLWRMPAWIGVPATALATMLFIFLLSHLNDREVVKVITNQEAPEKRGYDIVSYQDKAEVVFTAPKRDIPGIGFFGAARKRSEPFNGLQIRAQDDRHLFLKWSEIKTARLYEVKVYSVGDQGRTLIGQAATSGNTEIVLNISGIMPGRRYEWELMGQTTDGGGFFTRGGFVVGVEVRF